MNSLCFELYFTRYSCLRLGVTEVCVRERDFDQGALGEGAGSPKWQRGPWFPFATWVNQHLPALVPWPKNEGKLNPQILLKNERCLPTGIPISIYFHSTMKMWIADHNRKSQNSIKPININLPLNTRSGKLSGSPVTEKERFYNCIKSKLHIMYCIHFHSRYKSPKVCVLLSTLLITLRNITLAISKTTSQ